MVLLWYRFSKPRTGLERASDSSPADSCRISPTSWTERPSYPHRAESRLIFRQCFEGNAIFQSCQNITATFTDPWFHRSFALPVYEFASVLIDSVSHPFNRQMAVKCLHFSIFVTNVQDHIEPSPPCRERQRGLLGRLTGSRLLGRFLALLSHIDDRWLSPRPPAESQTV